MYRVFVPEDNYTKDWFSFEFALTDVLSRGFGKSEGWTIQKLPDQGA